MHTDETIPNDMAHGPYPLVHTVGELKEQLARLPDDLPINFDDGGVAVVYNVGDPTCHFALDPPWEWRDDELAK